jgi:hypothetical protein
VEITRRIGEHRQGVMFGAVGINVCMIQAIGLPLELPLPFDFGRVVLGNGFFVHSYRLSLPYIIKQNTLHPLRDEGLLRGTTLVAGNNTPASPAAVTGYPGAGYLVSPVQPACISQTDKRVQSQCSAGTLLGSHLALPTRWRMTYYSCQAYYYLIKKRVLCMNSDPLFSGPRGTRTPGLLNAIETRSQLRYGPVENFFRFVKSGTNPGRGQSPVDLRGFEPLASSVRLKRAPNCATGPF